MAIPVEPKMSDSLPWLRSYEPGRSALGLRYRGDASESHASGIVVTRDINFQNKLELLAFRSSPPKNSGIEEHR